jgi:hypothetical protein
MIPISESVKQDIRAYILQQCPFAKRGVWDANSDEPYMTGDFLGRMRNEWTAAPGESTVGWPVSERRHGEDSGRKVVCVVPLPL